MANFVQCPAHSCSNRKRQHDSWFPGFAVTIMLANSFLVQVAVARHRRILLLEKLGNLRVVTHFKRRLDSRQSTNVDSQLNSYCNAQGTWATLSEFASVSFNPSLGLNIQKSVQIYKIQILWSDYDGILYICVYILLYIYIISNIYFDLTKNIRKS